MSVASLILNSLHAAPTRHWQPGSGGVLDVWVQAVNGRGGFGLWCRNVVFEPAQMPDILDCHAD
jgi:hypothetical protein